MTGHREAGRTSAEALCREVQEYVANRRWNEAKRTYEYIMRAYHDQLSAAQRADLRRAATPIILLAQMGGSIPHQRLPVTPSKIDRRPKKNPPELEDTIPFPESLWEELLRLKPIIGDCIRHDFSDNTWLEKQMDKLQKMPRKKRPAGLALFFKACKENMKMNTLSMEVMNLILTMFYTHSIITHQECAAWRTYFSE